MYITDEQIEKLKEDYVDNRRNLRELDRFIEEHGMTNDGLTDSTESFEQGYNNALEFVFATLGIGYFTLIDSE